MDFENNIKNWNKLAKDDPLWAICTDPAKKGGQWNQEDFFAAGENEINTVFDYLRQKNINPADFKSALDFGCGLGRLSRPLAEKFGVVYGVDAAKSMIDRAIKLNQGQYKNIIFKLNSKDNLDFFKTDSISFIYSSLVLQHIPYPESISYIKEFLRILKPGGILVFQEITKDIRQLGLLKKIQCRIGIKGRLAKLGIGRGYRMTMNVVPAEEIISTINSHRGKVLDISTTNHASAGPSQPLRYINEKNSREYISQQFIVKKLLLKSDEPLDEILKKTAYPLLDALD